MVRETVLRLRRAKSMLLDPVDPNARSAGSFFMNPLLSAAAFAELERRWRSGGETAPIPNYPAEGAIKVPAARLVERAGFPQGDRQGGAAGSSPPAAAALEPGGTG